MAHYRGGRPLDGRCWWTVKRLNLGTDGHGKWAAWVEAAARGRIEGARNLAGDDDFLALFIGMGRQGGGKQRLCVGMQRFVAQLVAGALLHDLAKVHDDDIGAQVQDGREVMGDEQITETQLLLQVLQQIHNLGADGDIQRRNWFVEDDKTGVQRQGSGNGDALSLSAAEFMREEIDGAGIEPDQPE